MDKPKLTKEQVETLFETKYIRVDDLRYPGAGHYYSATRRKADRILSVLSDEEFKKTLPDAATCIVIIRQPSGEAKLLLTKEFRYPVGQYLLSPPAGLLDERDADAPSPCIAAAVREIKEETGLELKDTDKVFAVDPLCFSSPGMTDESNAMVCAVVDCDGIPDLNSKGTEGIELIGDYRLYSREDALRLLKQCRDDEGIWYSIYTWAALMYFVSGMWKEHL